jgi:hypothetical protein
MKVLSQRQSLWNRDDFAAIGAWLIPKSQEHQELMVARQMCHNRAESIRYVKVRAISGH